MPGTALRSLLADADGPTLAYASVLAHLHGGADLSRALHDAVRGGGEGAEVSEALVKKTGVDKAGHKYTRMVNADAPTGTDATRPAAGDDHAPVPFDEAAVAQAAGSMPGLSDADRGGFVEAVRGIFGAGKKAVALAKAVASTVHEEAKLWASKLALWGVSYEDALNNLDELSNPLKATSAHGIDHVAAATGIPSASWIGLNLVPKIATYALTKVKSLLSRTKTEGILWEEDGRERVIAKFRAAMQAAVLRGLGLGEDTGSVAESLFREDTANADTVPPELLAALLVAHERGDHDAVDELIDLADDPDLLAAVLDGPPDDADDVLSEARDRSHLVFDKTKHRWVNPNKQPRPERKTAPGQSPKEQLVARKQAAEPARQAARAAWGEAVSKGVTADQLPELAGHLQALTRDELREVARGLQKRVGGLKREVVDRLLAHVGAQPTTGQSKQDEPTGNADARAEYAAAKEKADAAKKAVMDAAAQGLDKSDPKTFSSLMIAATRAAQSAKDMAWAVTLAHGGTTTTGKPVAPSTQPSLPQAEPKSASKAEPKAVTTAVVPAASGGNPFQGDAVAAVRDGQATAKKHRDQYQAELATVVPDTSNRTPAEKLGIPAFDAKNPEHVRALRLLADAIDTWQPGRNPSSDPVNLALERFASIFGPEALNTALLTNSRKALLTTAGQVKGALLSAVGPEASKFTGTAANGVRYVNGVPQKGDDETPTIQQPTATEEPTDARPTGPDADPAAGPAPGGFADAERGGAGGGGAAGDARRTAPIGVVTARADHTPAADLSLVPDKVRPHLRPVQQEGVAHALKAMGEKGGFLLDDGPGTGKTRQILGVAQHYLDQGKKVLIVAPSEVIKPDWGKGTLYGSFDADGKAMGVPTRLASEPSHLAPGTAAITSYEKMKEFGDHVGDDTVVIFDEAHYLKNRDSARSKQGREIAGKAHAVMYSTATPGDKPLHLAYLARAGVFGTAGVEATYTKLGLELHDQRIGGGQTRKVWRINPRVGAAEARRRIGGLFDQMTREGLMVRRELDTSDMDFGTSHIPLSDDQRAELSEVERKVKAKTDNAAVAMMAARLHQEPMKIPATVDAIREELAAGRSPVIFVGRVNAIGDDGEDDDEAKAALGDLDIRSDGTATALKKALIEAGVPEKDIAELHGGATKTPAQKKKAMDRFQSGQAKVMIATIQSGGTGVNLDDTVGDRPRTAIIMTPPFSANDMAQATGRVHRLNTQSRSKVRLMLSDSAVDRRNADTLREKFGTLQSMAGGQASASQGVFGDAPDAAPAEPFAWGAELGAGVGTGGKHHFDVPAYHNAMAERFGGRRVKRGEQWTTEFPSRGHFAQYQAAADEDRKAHEAKRAAQQADPQQPARHHTDGSFASLRSGGWGIRVPAGARVGDTATVRTRDGREQKVRITRVVASYSDATIAEFSKV